jgi:transposase
MPARRLSMRKVFELMRLQAEGLSVRQISASLQLARSTVSDYLGRIEAAALSWPLPEDLDRSEVLERLFGPEAARRAGRPAPDWSRIHTERQRRGVTLQLLWLEYKAAHPEGYQYSRFCELYGRWRSSIEPVMRQPYQAGERVFVDYAGQTMPIVDRETGEVRDAQIFVATLGASNYIYAEATWTQSLPDWIASHERLYRHLGGVPALTVPDNLKTGITKACYYEPDVNPTYQDLATHFGTVVLPTRVAKPRDKAKVETGVQLVERWCLAPLRNHTFFSLAELNRELARRVAALNDRAFQKMDGNRRLLLELLERPALKPLPAAPFEYCEWKKARVNIDYHIQVEGHLYSVPYALVRKEVDVRITARTVEVLHHGRRVAVHPRSYTRGRFTTDPEHRPKSHRAHLEWTPTRLIRWGHSIGVSCGELVRGILESKPHPEQGYRSCLGLLSLVRRYDKQRLEAACTRALRSGATSYRSVKSILEHGLDQVAIEDDQTSLILPAAHPNVRGAAYYSTHAEGIQS